jgi:hypothetical protein
VCILSFAEEPSSNVVYNVADLLRSPVGSMAQDQQGTGEQAKSTDVAEDKVKKVDPRPIVSIWSLFFLCFSDNILSGSDSDMQVRAPTWQDVFSKANYFDGYHRLFAHQLFRLSQTDTDLTFVE